MRQSNLPKAILFDMDGTLTEPFFDYALIKREMGIGPGPILEAMALLDEQKRLAAEEVLLRHEHRAAAESTLNSGCVELLGWLDQMKIGRALVTRNRRKNVDTVFKRHGLHFDVCVSRDDGKFKPDPAPLQLACARLGVDCGDVWMVGDGSFDIEAGNAAKIKTVWISHGEPKTFVAEPWRSVRDLVELMRMLRGEE